MAGREDHPAYGAVFADQVGRGRSGKDAASGGNQPDNAMGGGHAGDHGDGFAVAVATVTSHHQGAAGHAGQHLEARLDEALQVVGGLKLAAAFAQAGGAGLLVGERLGQGNLPNAHGIAAGHRPNPTGHWGPKLALACHHPRTG